MLANPLNLLGAGAENRTRMTVRSEDFESSASTSFTTPALGGFIVNSHAIVNKFVSRICQYGQYPMF